MKRQKKKNLKLKWLIDFFALFLIKSFHTTKKLGRNFLLILHIYKYYLSTRSI